MVTSRGSEPVTMMGFTTRSRNGSALRADRVILRACFDVPEYRASLRDRGPLAQRNERAPYKRRVRGSTPLRPTNHVRAHVGTNELRDEPTNGFETLTRATLR